MRRALVRRALTALAVTGALVGVPVVGEATGTAERVAAAPCRERAPSLEYRPPLPGPVARFFAAPVVRWAAGHRGVDLAGSAGEPVRAPAEGTVAFSGRVVDRVVLTIRHPDGLRSSLEPLDEPLPLGAVVDAGDPVGLLAASPVHCGATTCLHWGVRRGDVYTDPLRLLAPAPVVLLPARPRSGAVALLERRPQPQHRGRVHLGDP